MARVRLRCSRFRGEVVSETGISRLSPSLFYHPLNGSIY